jgi:LRR receptor-like serine/threonine-protein kinase FLS2
MLYVGEIPFSLFNISSLREISLNGNNLNGSLSNEMCHQLTQLNTFSLRSNDYGGSIPRSIENCTSLQHLSLTDNFFSGIPSIFYLHV